MGPSQKVDSIRRMARERRESMTEAEREQQAAEASRSVEQSFRDAADKVRENRLRRMAERQGLRLEKSRRRDERAYDFGTYQLVDPYNSNALVAYGMQNGYGLDLDDIERELTERTAGTRNAPATHERTEAAFS